MYEFQFTFPNAGAYNLFFTVPSMNIGFERFPQRTIQVDCQVILAVVHTNEEIIMLRDMYKILVMLMLGVLLASCTASSYPTRKTEFSETLSNKTEDKHKEGEVHRHINPEDATAQIQLVLVPSEVIVGPNRFAVGIFDQGGDLVHEADVHLHFYDLTDHSNPFFESEADAYSLSTERGDVTIFAYDREFSHAGDWGVEVEVTFPDGSEALSGIRFFVEEDSPSRFARRVCFRSGVHREYVDAGRIPHYNGCYAGSGRGGRHWQRV